MTETIHSLINALLIGIILSFTIQLMVKRKARLKPGRLGLYTLMNVASYFLLGWIPFPIPRMIVWVLIATLLMFIFYRMGRVVQNILYVSVFTALNTIGQVILFLFARRADNSAVSPNYWNTYLAGNLIFLALCGAVLLLWLFFSRNSLESIYRVMYSKLENTPPQMYVHITIILMIILSVIGLFFVYQGMADQHIRRYKFSFYIPFLLVPVVNLLGYLLYKLAIRNKIKLDEQKNKYSQLLIYTNIIEKLTKNMRSFRHDFNNILLTMRSYIENDDLNGLRSYYTQQILENQSVALNENSVFLDIELIKCIPLKGLLTTVMQKALKKNINVSFYIDEYLENTDMLDIDLCRVMGIFLDNAIEAAKKTEEKILSISIMQDGDGTISIIVANSYKEKPKMSGLFIEGYSTKGGGRGTGLFSISNILKGYQHVTLNTVIEDKLFIQELNIKSHCRE